MKEKKSIQVFGETATRKKIAYRIPLKNKETGQRIEVAVFKSKQDDDADPRPLMLDEATKCWEVISHDCKAISHKKAVSATKLLDASGCDWVQVLAHVEQYCQYPSSELKVLHAEVAKFFLKLNRKIGKFESKMTKWETEIGKINSEIEEWLHVDATAHALNFDA